MSYGDSENAMLIQDQIKAAIHERDEYNGWKNYPTWSVNLWLSNDGGLYNETLALVRRVVKDCESTVSYLADSLKQWVTNDLAPDLGASFAADLLGYALDCVDWNEIAKAWLQDSE